MVYKGVHLRVYLQAKTGGVDGCGVVVGWLVDDNMEREKTTKECQHNSG